MNYSPESTLFTVRTGPVYAQVFVVNDGQFSQLPIFTGEISEANAFVRDWSEGDPMTRFVMEGGAQ